MMSACFKQDSPLVMYNPVIGKDCVQVRSLHSYDMWHAM